MSKLEELRDDRGGEVLAAERTADTTTSQQSGETFCYVKDFDVFDDFGRYEEWIDEYPEVMLRLCDGAEGVADLVAEFDFGVAGLGLVDAVRLPDNFFGNIPEFREATPEESNYTVENIRVVVFQLEFNFPDVSGVMRKKENFVSFDDLFRDPETGLPYSAESYTIEFDSQIIGNNSFLHTYLASVHPRENINFLNLSPVQAPVDNWTWHQARVPGLRINGDNDHHPLNRGQEATDTATTYGAIGAWVAGVAGLGSVPGRTILGSSVRGMFRAGRIPTAISTVATVGSNYVSSVTGYNLGTVYVTPLNGEEAAEIELVVAGSFEDN